MSCEVVDIKELPHTPQSGSSTNPLTFWPNTSVSWHNRSEDHFLSFMVYLLKISEWKSVFKHTQFYVDLQQKIESFCLKVIGYVSTVQGLFKF